MGEVHCTEGKESRFGLLAGVSFRPGGSVEKQAALAPFRSIRAGGECIFLAAIRLPNDPPRIMLPLRLLSIVFLGGFFAACTVAPIQPSRTSSDSSESSSDLSAVKMPVLRSAFFEKQWGASSVETSGDGGYRMRFR